MVLLWGLTVLFVKILEQSLAYMRPQISFYSPVKKGFTDHLSLLIY